jgi:hypothetical protein
MEFYAVLEQVLDLLRRRGRVSYRALKAQFSLDRPRKRGEAGVSGDSSCQGLGTARLGRRRGDDFQRDELQRGK